MLKTTDTRPENVKVGDKLFIGYNPSGSANVSTVIKAEWDKGMYWFKLANDDNSITWKSHNGIHRDGLSVVVE